jgi:hypothetical protein
MFLKTIFGCTQRIKTICVFLAPSCASFMNYRI